MKLYANRQCRTCHGKGWVQESHGEVLDCDCIFIGTTHTDDEIDAALSSCTVEVVPDIGDPILDLMVSSKEDSMTYCKCCGYPLILKSDFSSEEIAENEGMFEDNNEGLCGSCHMYPNGINKFKE